LGYIVALKIYERDNIAQDSTHTIIIEKIQLSKESVGSGYLPQLK
jgi:hypothetical protein